MSNKAKVIASVILVSVVTIAIYFPSFWHIFRGETYPYLLETKGDNNLLSLITHYFNYEKIRVYNPGDTLLFRPLLFTVMGLEKAIFGLNYAGWHIMSLIFHLLASLALFRLLWAIKPGVIALLVTLLFSTAYMGINTVLYEHIGAYLLFTALELTAAYYFYKAFREQSGYNLAMILIPMTLASLIYEVGWVMLAIFGVMAWRKKLIPRWRPYKTIIRIFIIFGIFYAFQKLVNPSPLLAQETLSHVNIAGIINSLAGVVIVLQTWLYQVIIPAQHALVPIEELRFQTAGVDLAPRSAMVSAMTVANVLLLLVIAWVTIRAKKLTIGKDNRILLYMMLLYASAIVAIPTLFRSSTLGMTYVANHNFAPYIWLAMFMVVIFLLLVSRTYTNWQRNLLAVAISLMILFSAVKVYSLNQAVNEIDAPIRSYISTTNQIVSDHKDEWDFSLRVDVSPQLEDRLAINLWHIGRNGKVVTDNFTMPEIFYQDYWTDRKGATYIVDWK